MSSISVFLKLHEYLARRASLDVTPREVIEVTLPSGSTLEHLMEHLGLDTTTVGLMVVNGTQVQAEASLSHHDEVEFFPPLSGG